ncbi:unnamed protein product [Ambrosiozyma monospora]|uniref:Unnamed protein product n=1 Tax=Ambrosiozyma monospora TaxID=43982 RepID=A0ACB5TBQ0_AMBMO|nr:unnamed protein product [Ambrosiozyma monospora]
MKSSNWIRLCNKYGVSDKLQSKSSSYLHNGIILDVFFQDNLAFKQMVLPHCYTVGKLRGYASRKLGFNVLDFKMYFAFVETSTQLEVLENDQELLGRFNLHDGDFIFVKT